MCKWNMKPVENTTGMGEGGGSEKDGGHEFKYNMFVSVTMYPQHNSKNQ
jgi:hypothetical protein